MRVHAFPDADVPVIQLAIDMRRSYDQHLALGAALAPLRDRGVMIVGSGNVVHNLGLVDWHRPDGGEAWADRFDEAAIELMVDDPGAAPVSPSTRTTPGPSPRPTTSSRCSTSPGRRRPPTRRPRSCSPGGSWGRSR